VGQTLFHEFLLPFEMSSVLFLSAMVGALMFGKKDHVEGD
jgi:NADH-quinone oxidoreductase subunit J